VQSQPGAHVEFEVGVMHAMKPPKRRHCVEQHMLEISQKPEFHAQRTICVISIL
jgi:hypothetical protein